ncbi:hypothetical protein CKAH01_01860 [Colletotrichum kahawae]|uniref:Transcription initiation factor TFIID subunit 4 n=1 Tax=Colletotrichum kahawae TaxID=34407 RepID=A0AAE0D0X0_COLKA|nr:hypothetical protein CKAH01_01860 [Colletotrichum kahawae]
MAQPQPQMPQRAFSPPQPTPSPAATQPGFALPPNKRPRLSPGATPQPESPYSTSPYAASPGAPVTPSTAATSAGSPIYPNAQSQQQAQPQQQSVANNYSTPYANGNSTPTLALPEQRPTPQPQVTTPQPPTPPTLPYTNAQLALGATPGTPAMQQPSPTPGAMGPPSRPPDRPQKEYDYDPTDSLAGTGIDLRAEEQYLSDLYVPDGQRTGYAPYPPGNKGSFYGAGPANQPAQPAGVTTQNALVAQEAEKAWQESAKRLATTRTMELNNAFLQIPIIFRKAEKFAKEQGLSLNLEIKNNNQPMGRMRLPEEFPNPSVTVSTKTGPDATMVTTTGTWIPQEAYLVDQLALLSLATKQRLRTLMEDSNRVAKNRQNSSHGEVPEEWQTAAAPLKSAMETQEVDATQQMGTENGSSPRPQKRSLEDAHSSQPSKVQKIAATNTMSHTVREVGKAERDWEERRLRRRNARKDGTAEAGSTTSRAGSVAPGTPGGSAPDSEKQITKKEQKKLDAVKKAEASSHANQNITSSMFVGMPKTGSLFGKKKGGKSYSWMTGGSGATTPRLGTPGKAGGAAASGPPAPANHALTVEGRARLGSWREDKEKGRNIQLRDWVAALEGDEVEQRAMQAAYDRMDTSDPK